MRLGNGLGTRDDDQGQPCARLAVAAGRALLPAAAAAAAAAPQRPLAPAAAGLQGHCWRLGAGAGAGRGLGSAGSARLRMLIVRAYGSLLTNSLMPLLRTRPLLLCCA